MVVSCIICQERLDNPPDAEIVAGRDKTCSTRCGHVFHFGCINNWWKHTNAGNDPSGVTCPVCRRTLGNMTVFELFLTTRDDSFILNDTPDFINIKQKNAALETNIMKLTENWNELKSKEHAYGKELENLKKKLSVMEREKEEVSSRNRNLKKLIRSSEIEHNKSMKKSADQLSTIKLGTLKQVKVQTIKIKNLKHECRRLQIITQEVNEQKLKMEYQIQDVQIKLRTKESEHQNLENKLLRQELITKSHIREIRALNDKVQTLTYNLQKLKPEKKRSENSEIQVEDDISFVLDTKMEKSSQVENIEYVREAKKLKSDKNKSAALSVSEYSSAHTNEIECHPMKLRDRQPREYKYIVGPLRSTMPLKINTIDILVPNYL